MGSKGGCDFFLLFDSRYLFYFLYKKLSQDGKYQMFFLHITCVLGACLCDVWWCVCGGPSEARYKILRYAAQSIQNNPGECFASKVSAKCNVWG